MVLKIINESDLNYKDIGSMIDIIQQKVTTNHVGKYTVYEFDVNDKRYIVLTEIMKTCFKVRVGNKSEV